MRQNLKTKFKNVVVHKLFHDAAYTCHLLEFNVIFRQLQMISPRATIHVTNADVD